MNDHPDLPASGPALAGLDRRGFLKTGLGGALVLAGAGPLSGPKTLEADVVVIGTGRLQTGGPAPAPGHGTPQVRLFTARQMGGCAMGPNPETSVVNGFGEHYPVSNLSVHDASRFPTRIGANPQLSVYARSARNSHHLAGQSRFSRAGTRAAGTYRCPGNAGIMAASEGRSCA